jgi:predicted amidohydrolase YtcJ
MTVTGASGPVDLLVTNGTLLLDRASAPLAGGAVAVRDGGIVGVGATPAILSRFRAETVLDAAGGLVHPGFVDAHVHLHQHLGRSVIPDS